MEVRNCKGCGKLFNYMPGQPPLCQACLKQLDLKFEQVKQYVYDHPNANIQQVAEENEVTVNQIKKWVREERLAFSENSGIGLSCESCGAMILTGRYCKKCKEKMGNSLSKLYEKQKEAPVKKTQDTSAKMRFLH
ncbi:MAG: flagellar protein [Clostridiales bacterium]|nr:flagellar protein [Clostridiales bacterium]